MGLALMKVITGEGFIAVYSIKIEYTNERGWVDVLPWLLNDSFLAWASCQKLLDEVPCVISLVDDDLASG